MKFRFLDKREFINTKDLAKECFGETEELDNYYADDIFDNRIAVAEDGNNIVSMIQLRGMLVEFSEKTELVWYILYVATKIEQRKQGYMQNLMNFVLENLKKEGATQTFLVPVNEKIYEKFGFVHKWKFSDDEAEILYADDGLEFCYFCMLNNDEFAKPKKIKKPMSIKEFEYKKFGYEDAIENFDFFHIRENKGYNSVPLESAMWSETLGTTYAVLDNRCFVMTNKSGKRNAGYIPFCKENELIYYFRLQERYFNEVLKMPFCAYLAENEGVYYLQKYGVLDNYTVTEDTEIFDYIYSGDDLRTLVGKKFSDKRNRINKFLRNFEGRWQYKSLAYNDTPEIIEFLKKWYSTKTIEGKGVNLGEEYDAAKTLEIEKEGLFKILKTPELMKKIKAGGIYVDGSLSAFSIGSYNPRENMAIIEIEKAFVEMEGLYQLINREFLCHEFPDVELVNREDDNGLPGLRRAKMTYNPIAFVKRFNLKQQDFKEGV